MREIIPILTLLLSPYLSAQYIDRYIDGKVEFIEPSPFQTIQSPVNLKISFLFTNQGPDTLYPDDTIIWQTWFDLIPEDYPEVRKAIGQYIVPGAHFILNDILFVNSDQNSSDALLGFSISPQCYGRQTDKRALRAELYVDRLKDNRPFIPLVHKVSTSINTPKYEVNIFPNPSNGIIFIQSNNPITESDIELIDGLGVTHSFQIFEDLGSNRLKLDFGKLKPGLYAVRIRQDDKISVRTLVIY